MRRSRRKYKQKEDKKKKRKVNKSRIFLFLVLISLLGYGIYSYLAFSNIKSINPLSASNSDYFLLSNRKDALEKTLIVFEEYHNEREVIQRVYLYAENKEKNKSVLIHIPGWLEYVGLERDFGTGVPISTFRYAGEFLQKDRGFEYAIWQFQQILGTNIDNYIWFSADSMQLLEEKLGKPSESSIYAQYYLNGFEVSDETFFLNGFVSRLSWINLVLSSSGFRDSESIVYSSFSTLINGVVKLKEIHRSTLSMRPYIIDLAQKEYISFEESTSRIGITSVIDVSSYDSVWREFVDSLVDRELEKERVRVEVYNGSGLTGYASQYARKIRNSGLEVVRYDNAPDIQQSTEFFVPNPNDFSNSLEIIMEIFPGSYEIVQGRPSFMTTGDIVVILGEDIPTVYSF